MYVITNQRLQTVLRNYIARLEWPVPRPVGHKTGAQIHWIVSICNPMLYKLVCLQFFIFFYFGGGGGGGGGGRDISMYWPTFQCSEQEGAN